MLRYSPFQAPLDQLTAINLENLKDVSEGWYVEYKREANDAKTIAKAVSAFSNTYGGWLFFGIEEKSKEDAVAGNFVGIPKDKLEMLLQRIRQGTEAHLSPMPHFDTKIIWGPCSEIGLLKDAAIVCIEIPKSLQAPHIHSDGRIYRRVADSSEPKPETDRLILDQMWDRRKERVQSTKDWVERKPKFSKSEKQNAYVRLLIAVDPWGIRDPRLSGTLDEYRDILGECEFGGQGIKFDSVHISSNGIIARHCANNDPSNIGLTWIIREDLSSEVLIPTTILRPSEMEDIKFALKGYDNAERYQQLLKNAGFANPKIVDLNLLFIILTTISSKQRQLLKKSEAKPEYFVKAQILNAGRTIPFIDTKSIIDKFDANGIPVLLNSETTVPSSTHPDTFHFVEQYDCKDSEKKPEDIDEIVAATQQALSILKKIVSAWGISESELVYGELNAVVGRAMTAQEIRNPK